MQWSLAEDPDLTHIAESHVSQVDCYLISTVGCRFFFCRSCLSLFFFLSLGLSSGISPLFLLNDRLLLSFCAIFLHLSASFLDFLCLSFAALAFLFLFFSSFSLSATCLSSLSRAFLNFSTVWLVLLFQVPSSAFPSLDLSVLLHPSQPPSSSSPPPSLVAGEELWLVCYCG